MSIRIFKVYNTETLCDDRSKTVWINNNLWSILKLSIFDLVLFSLGCTIRADAPHSTFLISNCIFENISLTSLCSFHNYFFILIHGRLSTTVLQGEYRQNKSPSSLQIQVHSQRYENIQTQAYLRRCWRMRKCLDPCGLQGVKDTKRTQKLDCDLRCITNVSPSFPEYRIWLLTTWSCTIYTSCCLSFLLGFTNFLLHMVTHMTNSH